MNSGGTSFSMPFVKMPHSYYPGILNTVAFISFIVQYAGANSTTTAIQLRKSVQFSYDGADLFLDLIRGNASRNATDQLLAVYLGSFFFFSCYCLDLKNYELPTILLTPVS